MQIQSPHVRLNEHPLNTSDHISVSAVLGMQAVGKSQLLDFEGSRTLIDWRKARTSNAIDAYSREIGKLLLPMVGKSYTSVEELDADIKRVTNIIEDTAQRVLPLKKRKHGINPRIGDRNLFSSM